MTLALQPLTGTVLRRLTSLWADKRSAYALTALAWGAAYYVSGYYGIVAKVPPANVATVWPPCAVLLAALLLTPRERWWHCFAVVIPVHLYLFITCMPGMPGITMGVQLTGYMAQAWVTAAWLTRHDQALRLDTLRGVTRFILIGVMIAPALFSAAIVFFYTLTGWSEDFWTVWRQRLLSNMVPTITITPLIVLTLGDGWACLKRTTRRSYLEFAGLLVALSAVGFAVFGWNVQRAEALPALLYALLPLLLWSAVRFEPSALYSCLMVIAFASLIATYHDRGPFVTLTRAENVLALQLFLIAISAPLMLFAAVVQERHRTARALRESQDRYSMATAAGSSGVWDWNIRSGALYIDPALKQLLGYEDAEIENTMAAWTECMHPDDRAGLLALTQQYLSGQSVSFEAEHRALHKNGSVRWFMCRGVTTEYENGIPVRMMGTDTDITERKQAEQALRRSRERIREMAGRLISAQEEERRRIARDLHDDLNQKMAALSIELSNFKQLLPATDHQLLRELGQLQLRTTNLVQDIRELSHEIHPAILEHGGLVPALTSFAAELHRMEGFELRLSLPDRAERLPRGVAIGIYRIVQESVRNAVRHSGAHKATIALTLDGNEAVTLVIRDEGRGFDVARIRDQGGLGLISIEERVHLLNGRLELASQQDKGTILKVKVPLPTTSAVA